MVLTTCHLSFLGCLTAFTAEDELTVEVHQATELHLAQLLLVQPLSAWKNIPLQALTLWSTCSWTWELLENTVPN